MNISFQSYHLGDISPLAPEVTNLVDLVIRAGSAPVEELHRTYGGTLPQEMFVIFMREPVARRIKWRDGQLDVADTLGLVLAQGNGVFIVVLGLGPALRKTTLHEYMHVLGHTEEGFVKKAVEDFTKYHRWKASV